MPRVVDHDARRSQISEVAAALIAEGGMEAATIRGIADACGYSKGVIEHYFDGKGELIDGALAWVNRCYENRVDKLTAGREGLAALRKRIEASLPLDLATRKEWKVRLVFWSMAAIDADLASGQARRFRRAVDYFERDILVAIAAGEMPPCADTATVARRLVNMTTGISTAALHDRARYSRSMLLSELDAMLVQLQAGR